MNPLDKSIGLIQQDIEILYNVTLKLRNELTQLKESKMDKKIRKIESMNKKEGKQLKSLEKMDKKQDKVVAKAKMKMKGKC